VEFIPEEAGGVPPQDYIGAPVGRVTASSMTDSLPGCGGCTQAEAAYAWIKPWLFGANSSLVNLHGVVLPILRRWSLATAGAPGGDSLETRGHIRGATEFIPAAAEDQASGSCSWKVDPKKLQPAPYAVIEPPPLSVEG
jgi:hypothetical protein